MRNYGFSREIEDLIHEQDETCLTLTLSLYIKSPDRQKNYLRLQKLMRSAKEELEIIVGPVRARKIYRKAEALLSRLDLVHPPEGIGIYVSNGMASLIKFPFKVSARIVVNHRFEIRDLIYLDQFTREFYVLALSGKDSRLYRFKGPEMKMIKDRNFPVTYTDQYEYSRTSMSSGKGVHTLRRQIERDKGALKDIRLKNHYGEVDRMLNDYLDRHARLIVAGPVKELSLFMEVSRHTKNIEGTIEGNFLRSQNKLADCAWRKMKTARKKTERALIKQLREMQGRMVFGAQGAWESIKDGNAYRLIVEKDYSVPGFLDKNLHLRFSSPDSDSEMVEDAIDLLIKSILEKSGEVEFVDNGNLSEYEGVALVTRF